MTDKKLALIEAFGGGFKKETGSLGKFRIILHVTEDTDQYCWFELGEVSFFYEGFETDFDEKSCSMQDHITGFKYDIAEDIIRDYDKKSEFKIDDCIEIYGDLWHEASGPYHDGEYDETFWMEKIQYHKLNEHASKCYFPKETDTDEKD